MKFEVLVRLIGAADPASLREIALVCLHARGFEPEITDGPNDGGRDLRVFTLGGGRRYAVQTSVEAAWRSKAREDALKAKARLGVTDMLFVSSRRLPDVEFQELQDELAPHGVTLQKMDAQGIASLLQRKGLIPKALELLGLWRDEPPARAFERPDMRQEVAWSYAFFGVEPDTFRRGVIERAIISVVSRAGGSLAMDDVVDRVALSLGLSQTQRDQVRPAIDRLRQEGRVGGQNGTVRVSEDVRREQDALRQLRVRAREELVTSLAEALRPWLRVASRREMLAEQLVGDVSALLVDDARGTANALAHARRNESFTEARERTRRLAESLMAFGLDGDDDHRDALLAIAEAVRNSSLGRHLLAGEVFVNLVSLNTSQLVSAIAGRRALRAVLDSSVAMPMLAGLLYEPVAQRYSAAARHAYDQLKRHGVDVMVPADYVEEMAVHLNDAWPYRELVADEPDLRASKNAFVSHFVGMGTRFRQDGESARSAFSRYLDGFGFQPSLAAGDFVLARTHLQRRIAAFLSRYGVRVERPPVDMDAADGVWRELDRVLDSWRQGAEGRQRRAMRADILLRHDARTIAWLDAERVSDERATVFCTWDRLIFELYEAAPRAWEALTPAQLGDALMLAAPDDDETTAPVSVLDVALSLADEDAERGAKVLDRLVQIEKDTLHDAQVMAEARRFKAEWLKKSHRYNQELETEWAEWKRQHLPPRDAVAPPAGETEGEPS
ncbi:MAG: hypothetical protein U0326_41770 [Polyangiales bacterium]